MSGVTDKARFYLERAVPQLREWEEKGIFSKVCLPNPAKISPANLIAFTGGDSHYCPEAQRLRAQGPCSSKQTLGMVFICPMGAVP